MTILSGPVEIRSYMVYLKMKCEQVEATNMFTLVSKNIYNYENY